MPVLKFWNPYTRRYEPVSGPVGVMGDAPSARIVSSVVQSIAALSFITLTFNTVQWDSHGFANLGVNNDRFTIPAGMGGKYHLTARAWGAVGAGKGAAIECYVNGVGPSGGRGSSGSADGSAEPALGVDLNLVPGDYIQCKVWHNSATNPLNWGGTSGGTMTEMSLIKLAVGQPGPQGPPGDPTASRIDIPGVKVRWVGATTIVSGGWVQVQFNTEDRDTHGFFSGPSSNITIPTGQGGWYHFSGSFYGAAGWPLDTRLLLQLGINGALNTGPGIAQNSPSSSGETACVIGGDVYLPAGTTVQLFAYQDSGGTRNVGSATEPYIQPTLSLYKIEQVKGEKGDPGPAGNIPYNVGIEISGGTTTCGEYTYTAVDLDVATVMRNDGGFTISGDTFVVPATGWYAVAANGTWSAQDDQYRVLTIEHLRSAVQTRKNITYYNVVNSLDMAITVSGIYYLLAGDKIGFQAMHGGGASGNLGFTLTSASCVSVGGPKGADGAAGPTGATGSQGPTGPAGADGAQALVIPNLVFGTAAAAGAANNTIRSDATLPLFDSTAPVVQAFSDVAAAGSVAKAARRDHRHGMPAIPPHNRAAIWSVASPMLAAYGSWQYLEPAGVIYDPMGMIAYTAPTYTIYVPETGVYLCEAYGQWEAVVEPGPQRAHGLTLGSVAENQNIVHCQPGIGMVMSSSWTRYMGAGQAVAFMQYQDARLMYYWGGWCSVVRVG